MPTGSILKRRRCGDPHRLNRAVAPGYECARPATPPRCSAGQPGRRQSVIPDVVMPDENAFDLLPRIGRSGFDLPVIMRAQNTFMTAVRASGGAPTVSARRSISRKSRSSAALSEPRAPAAVGQGRDLESSLVAARRRCRKSAAGRAPDADRSHGDDLRGSTGGELVAPRCTITASAAADRSSPSTWRRSRATSSGQAVQAGKGGTTGANTRSASR
jgi:hypothetical protein